MNLFDVSKEMADLLTRIFTRDEHDRRPVYGSTEKFQSDPHWRDHLLFYEYFHGDNGAGLGARHQTGWTGLVAKMIQLYGFWIPSGPWKGANGPCLRRPRPRMAADERLGPAWGRTIPGLRQINTRSG